MAGRDGTKGNTQSRNAKKRRHQVAIVGAGAGAFLAAAAMATGSAAPAHADIIDTLLDPIIQPLMTSLSDAIAGFDPAAATDLTSWTDSLLASLNSIDLAVPSAAEPAAAAAASTTDSTSGTYDIPITVQESTEPTVQATVDGANTTLLVDTGSSGLVIPWQDLGSSSELSDLEALGFPTGFGFSGFSGGVDYLYLTYDTTVDYGNGTLDTSGTPVNVEIFSFPTSSTAPANFEDFLQDDDVSGILGIGDYEPGFLGIGAEAGPTESPLEAAGFGGVTVDIPNNELVVGSNAGDPIATLSGAPTPTSDLTEVVTTSTGTTVGSATVSDDIDSGGVYGTIPSSIGSLPDGDTITVSYSGTTLYSYTVENNGVNFGLNESPLSTSGDSIDSGFAPFNEEPIFINYTDDTLTFDAPPS
jgi:hypothetical protein